jgi:xylulokinase
LGKIAPIDISDVCGMNLWDIQQEKWSSELLEIVGGNAEELFSKLGDVEPDGGAHLGKVHPYFVQKYKFSKGTLSKRSLKVDCVIIPFTGDNPATITSLPLSPMDSIISLGTSTTLLLTTKMYKPSPSYHIFNHPTTKGLYFAMLCYKNGSLAREQIRNQINKNTSNDWESFNSCLSTTKPLNGPTPKKLGFYFPLPEIIPDAPNGTWRFLVNGSTPKKVEQWTAKEDARAIVESQALSMRLRAQPLSANGKPRHLYFVGGASQNSDIVSVMSQVLGSQEGVFRLTEGVTAGACARGSAIKAAWAIDGKGIEFEEFVRVRWNTEGKLDKLDVNDDQEIWDEYGSVLKVYSQCENIILSEKK